MQAHSKHPPIHFCSDYSYLQHQFQLKTLKITAPTTKLTTLCPVQPQNLFNSANFWYSTLSANTIEMRIAMLQSAGKHVFLPYLALTFVVLAVWQPLLHNDFIDFDTKIAILENPNVQHGINPKSIKWAFTTDLTANWMPMTWLSTTLDCQIFGLNPIGHHATSLMLHMANTLLIFWILRKTTAATPAALFVAAAFALHPLRVESVAWVIERKDVLSTFFALSAIAAYITYAKRPSFMRYLPVCLLMALGLMAKPMIVTLPCILLLLDYWPLYRSKSLDAPTDIPQKTMTFLLIEKLPLFALTIASSIITCTVQRSSGAMSFADTLSLPARFANAIAAYTTYLSKTAWPAKLAVLYPYHPVPTAQLLISIIAITAITAAAIVYRRKKPFFIVGWLWFLGSLIPVIGLIQVGRQSIADRYTYLPSIGLLIAIAFIAASFVKRSNTLKTIAAALALTLCLAMTVATRAQLNRWKNSATLYQHTIDVTKDNATMHFNLANVLYEQNNYDQAEHHYNMTIRIDPENPDAHNNLAGIFTQKGDYDAATTYYNKALTIDPDNLLALNNMANILLDNGKPDSAVRYFQKALAVDPDAPYTLQTLAHTYANLSRFPEAIQLWKKLLKLYPHDLNTLNSLSTAYAQNKDFDNAIKTIEKAIELTKTKGTKQLTKKLQTQLKQYKNKQLNK